MQQKDQNTSGQTSSGEKQERQQPGVPLSATIPDAHAAGDGALEREKETLLKPDDEKSSNRGDDAKKKGTEHY